MSKSYAIAIAVSLGVFVQLAPGQTDRGTITGVVVDPAHSGVPSATVIAQHLATGLQVRATATGTGAFSLPSLPSGEYSVTVDHPGFKKFIQSPIKVDVAQTVRVDVSLQMGAASESITVAADANANAEVLSGSYGRCRNGNRRERCKRKT